MEAYITTYHHHHFFKKGSNSTENKGVITGQDVGARGPSRGAEGVWIGELKVSQICCLQKSNSSKSRTPSVCWNARDIVTTDNSRRRRRFRRRRRGSRFRLRFYNLFIAFRHTIHLKQDMPLSPNSFLPWQSITDTNKLNCILERERERERVGSLTLMCEREGIWGELGG